MMNVSSPFLFSKHPSTTPPIFTQKQGIPSPVIARRFQGNAPPSEPPSEEPPKQKPSRLAKLKNWAFWGLVAIGCLPIAGQHILKKDPIQLVQSVHRNTRPCPEKIKTTLTPYFNLQPHQVNFETLQVVPEFSVGFKNRNHVLPGFTGTVVLNPEDYQAYLQFEQLSALEQRRLTLIFAHELTHLIQIQIMGRDAFIHRIAEESLAHKNVYDTSGELFQRVQAEKELQNRMDDPTMFVHPHITLEQSAVLVEQFIQKRF